MTRKNINQYHELLFISNLYPNRIIIKSKIHKMTYRNLLNKIEVVSAYFYYLGFRQDDCIEIVERYKYENIVLFYAMIKLGVKISEIKSDDESLIGVIYNANKSKKIYILRHEALKYKNQCFIKWNKIRLDENITIPIKEYKNECDFFRRIHDLIITLDKVII